MDPFPHDFDLDTDEAGLWCTSSLSLSSYTSMVFIRPNKKKISWLASFLLNVHGWARGLYFYLRDLSLFSRGEGHNFFLSCLGEGHNFLQGFLGEGHNFFKVFLLRK